MLTGSCKASELAKEKGSMNPSMVVVVIYCDASAWRVDQGKAEMRCSSGVISGSGVPKPYFSASPSSSFMSAFIKSKV